MADYQSQGLLNGVGAGLSSFATTFQNAQNMKYQRALQNQLMNLKMFESGIQKNPDSGNFELSDMGRYRLGRQQAEEHLNNAVKLIEPLGKVGIRPNQSQINQLQEENDNLNKPSGLLPGGMLQNSPGLLAPKDAQPTQDADAPDPMDAMPNLDDSDMGDSRMPNGSLDSPLPGDQAAATPSGPGDSNSLSGLIASNDQSDTTSDASAPLGAGATSPMRSPAGGPSPTPEKAGFEVDPNFITAQAATKAKLNLEQGKDTREKAEQAYKHEIESLKELKGDETFKTSYARTKQASGIKAQIAAATQNPVAANNIGLLMMRYLMPQGGRMSPQVLDSLGGGEKDIIGQMQQAAQTTKQGTITDKNAAYLNKLVDTVNKSDSQAVSSLALDQANDFKASNGSYPKWLPNYVPQKVVHPLTGKTLLFNPSTGKYGEAAR